MITTRRVLLQSGLSLSGSLLLGCSAEQPSPAGAGGDCSDRFATGTRLGIAPFVGESALPLEQPFNSGLDGRSYTDLSKLDAENLLTPSSAFYVRTRYPDLLVSESPWQISLATAGTLSNLFLDELLPFVASQGVHLLECSGNARGASFGLLSSAEWSGVPLLDVLTRAGVSREGSSLLVSGFDQHSEPSEGNQSTPGASWVFRFEELESTGAFLATEMNGEPLSLDHGAPLRLLVPGWYGCTCIKWVNELGIVDQDEPATSQMKEFASRTHQSGVPELARDYLAAEIDLSAMPVRVEKWLVAGRIVYRVVGIQWGGAGPASRLEIRFNDAAWREFEACATAGAGQTWTLWEYAWQPPAPGLYSIVLRAADRAIRTRRLDAGYYLREVAIDEV